MKHIKILLLLSWFIITINYLITKDFLIAVPSFLLLISLTNITKLSEK
jgi:hypothetical protein